MKTTTLPMLLIALLSLGGAWAPATASPTTQKPEAEATGPSDADAQSDAEDATGEPLDDAFDLQVMMAREGISPGVIDGHWGNNTRSALRVWQTRAGLDATGQLDAATKEALTEKSLVAKIDYTITEDDVAGPFLDELPEDTAEKAKLDHLGYTSPLEKLAERLWTTPEWLEENNAEATFAAGETIQAPNVAGVERPMPEGDFEVTVSKSGSYLELKGADGTVHFWAPVTSGSEANPLPIGDWKVVAISTEPTYTYDPAILTGVPDDGEVLELAAGPNSPVGSVWIDLDKEHYGLHGTPDPATIGYAESNGCVRLTNWDAMHLAHLVKAGTPVHFIE